MLHVIQKAFRKKKDPVESVKAPASNLSNAEKSLEPKKTIVEKKEFPNGISIQWFEKGNGEPVSDGEVYELNFKVKLTNGEVVDGNHRLHRDWLPFLAGYGMQTKGWDLAMKELHVGDFAEVFIPANLARGEKGIPGYIPPHSPNIVMIRVGKKINPTRIAGKTKVWLLEEQADVKDSIVGPNSNVSIHYFVGSKSNPKYDNSYHRQEPFTFNMKDNGILPGLKKALAGAKLSDKMYILIDPSEAYGKNGFLDRVKPNESIFYDLMIMEVK